MAHVIQVTLAGLAYLECRLAAQVELARPRVSRSSDAFVVAILQQITTDDAEVNGLLGDFIVKLSSVPPPPPDPVPVPLDRGPSAWSGDRLTAVWDMGALPDWVRSKGYDGSDSAIAYAMLTTWAMTRDWPQGGIPDNLYNGRDALADLAGSHVVALIPIIRAQGADTVVAVVNDGPDRLGRRCSHETVNQIGRAGFTIAPGDTVQD